MDIIFSVILILGAIYLYIFIGGASGTTAGLESLTDLGAAFWPRVILILLIILSVINLIQGLKKMKAEGTGITEGISVAGFFKSKLFIGMILVGIMAFILPQIGFLPTCFIFLIAYGLLLGEKKYLRLVIVALIITISIYVIFQGALDIFLPRGKGAFRTFALAVEKLLPF